MKIKTRLFRRIAETSKKVKVGLGLLVLAVLGGGAYGIVRATTANGATVTIASGTSYSYGTDYEGGVYSTSRFTVTSGGNSYLGMCLQPRLKTTNGSATVTKISNTSTSGKQLIRIMLISDSSFNSTIYNEFYSDNPNIWATAVATDPYLTSATAPFVMGHALAGYVYTGEWFAVDAYQTSLATALNTVNSWFNSNYPNEHKNWDIYSASSTSSDSWNRQDIGWIESNTTYGKVRLKKTDTDGTVLTNVSATFDLYRVSGGSYTKVASNIALKTNGYTAWQTVESGYEYCFSETAAPEGYLTAEDVCTSSAVAEDATVTVTMEDEPEITVAGKITINKRDADTGGKTPLGGASLDGAKFKVISVSQSTFETVCGGPAVNCMKNDLSTMPEYDSSVDWKYNKTLTISNNTANTGKVLSAGFYCVYETSTGTGYTKNSQVACVQMSEAQETIAFTYNNTVIKGGVTLTKKKKVGDTTTAFSGVKFKITSNSDSSFSALTITSNSSGVAQTTTTALPYGNYTITEVCDSANAAYDCSYSETFNVTTNGTRVTLKGNTSAADGTVLNTAKTPSISTKATVCDSSVTTVAVTNSACISDAITLSNFVSGSKYQIVAYLAEASGVAIKTQTLTWTQGSETSKTIKFEGVDTSDFINTTMYIWAKVQMYDGSSYVDVATVNRNNTDANERITVSGYEIETTAAGASGSVDSNGNLYAGAVTVIDTVKVTGLKNGTTYKIQGFITDGNGDKITLTNGDSGNEGFKTDSYTMSAASGTQVSTTMEFKFDASKYIGQTLTVYEKVLSSSGTELIAHNGGSTQQVKVVTPAVSTSAKNQEDDTRTVQIGDVTIIDYVTYSGLMPGNTYTLKATLYKTTDTSTAVATDTKSFTASTASGTTTASESPKFSISTGSLAGQTLVVYEELYYGNTKIAEHTNVNDSAQRIRVSEVDIQTIAMSAADGNTKAFNVGGNVTVTDTVKLKGLVNGTSYKVRGWLVDQSGTVVNIASGTGVSNNQVTVDYTMTATTGTRVTASMDFTFDSVAYAGKKLTVYEQLLDANSNVLASHAVLGEAAQTITITTPEIGTTITPKELYVGDQTLVDTVDYNNLVAGQKYTLITKLMKVNSDGSVTPVKNNGTAIEQSGTVQVPSGRTSGQFMVSIPFNTIEYQGADLVVYEYLQYDGVEIAKHEDATVGSTNSQWTKVKVAEIGTKAKDASDTDNIIEPEKNQKISDTVSYSGLQPGQKYTLSGKIMRKDTGTALKIDGEEITATKQFTASANGEGTVEMTFTLDATDLPGVSMVVFEDLYIGTEVSGEPLLTHEDLTDTEQLVVVRPRIGTTAEDGLDGDQEVGVGNVTILDTVKYEGLTIGKKYIAVGTLVNKEVLTRCKVEEDEEETDDGESSSSDSSSSDSSASDSSASDTEEEEETCIVEDKKIRNQVEFTVTGEGTAVITDGTITPLLEFYLSTRDLIGKEVVVFEEVYLADGYVEGESEPVAVHKDLEDESQIVVVAEPEIGTSAVDKIDGDKEVNNNGVVVIEDTVEYKNLVPGTQYILRGSLRNKESGEALTLLDSTIDGNVANGKKAKLSDDNKELSLIVTADRTNGKFYMDFEINADGLSGKELVVFETLYIETITENEEEEGYTFGEQEIAKHHDLTSEAQTVRVHVDPPDTGAVAKDGGAAKAVRVVLTLTFVAFGGALGGYFGMRMYKKRKMSL